MGLSCACGCRGLLFQHSHDVILGCFVCNILGSGIDQFTGHLKLCEFFLQQDSEIS